MRKFALTALVTLVVFVGTAASVLASSTGPGM